MHNNLKNVYNSTILIIFLGPCCLTCFTDCYTVLLKECNARLNGNTYVIL